MTMISPDISIVSSRANRKVRRARREAPDAGGSMADVLAPLVKDRRLTEEQIRGFAQLLADLQADRGSSGGVIGAWSDRVQTSFNPKATPARWTDSTDRLDALSRAMPLYHRDVISYLVLRTEQKRGDLVSWARTWSTYADRGTLLGCAVQRIAETGRWLNEWYQYHSRKAMLS